MPLSRGHRLTGALQITRNEFSQPFLVATPSQLRDAHIIDAVPSESQSPIPTGVHSQLLAESSTQSQSQAATQAAAFSQDAANSPPAMPPPPPIIPPFPSPPTQAPTPPPGTLHPDDLSTLTALTQVLSTQFDAAPPHTVQRLAELIQSPKQYYKSLPKYLRAVQRVLSVSSPISCFPLPQHPSETLANGTGGGGGSAGALGMLGSDESLGGALLTPIPWLTPTPLTEDTGGVNGSLSSEDGSSGAINGVSQGELLRHEQELNIIPATQVASPPRVSGPEEPRTTASQGPPSLGPADVGPQPAGTVFPDPPKSAEDIGSPPSFSMANAAAAAAAAAAADEDDRMKDADDNTPTEKQDEPVEGDEKAEAQEAKEDEDMQMDEGGTDEKK